MQTRQILLLAGAIFFISLSLNASEGAYEFTRTKTTMPMAFTKNIGQWPDSILFRADAGDAIMWFVRDGIYYQFTKHIPQPDSTNESNPQDVPFPPRRLDVEYRQCDSIQTALIKVEVVGANPNAVFEVGEELDYKCNYFLGNDPAKWHTDVPNYSAITIKGLIPGLDIIFKDDHGKMICEQREERESLSHQLQLRYGGAIAITAKENGTTVVQTTVGERTFAGISLVSEPTPVLSSGSSNAGTSSGVTLAYSTYLGGTYEDAGDGIAVDAGGNAYVTGYTRFSNFPTLNPFQASSGGGHDVFVTKVNSAGTGLIYSTYLGGNSWDYGVEIAVDAGGNAYVTGQTYSTNFPTLNPFQTSFGGNRDAFATKLNSAGNGLVYSTYLGGNSDDEGFGIAVDVGGNAYLTGITVSMDFPVQSPFQASNAGSFDAFVTKLNSAGSGLIYSTYLGGSGLEGFIGGGIAVDADGNAYVTGETYSTNFPTLNPFQSSNGGAPDVFVTKLNSAGNGLIYSTYLGGNSTDYGPKIAVDAGGCVYVTGIAGSANFPTLNPFQASNGGDYDAFVTKLNSAGSGLIYSTYLGGIGQEEGRGIAVDAGGNAYVTGRTLSSNFPTLNPFQASNGGDFDVFVTKLNSTGNGLIYSTYLGGNSIDLDGAIVVDAGGNAYITGSTGSVNFPTQNPFQASYGGFGDAFVTKFGANGGGQQTTFLMLDGNVAPQPIRSRLCRIFKHPSAESELYLGSGSTDANGLLLIDPLWNLQVGDPIRIEVLADRLANPRAFHDSVNGTAHNIIIDNAEVTSASGLLVNDTYQGVPSQPITLNHATVKYNLVVAFEWDAQSSTIDNFVAGLRKVANYFYDVTDGQATLDTVAIYDGGYADRPLYESADIRVEATNFMTGLAQAGTGYFQHKDGCAKALVRYPRMVYGLTSDATIELIDQFGVNWDDPGPRTFENQTYYYPGVQAIAHELGHYLLFNFDEYNNQRPDGGTPSCNGSPATGNFGLMDEPLTNGPANPMFGEMSGTYSYASAGSLNTTQYCIRDKSCFNYFEELYGGNSLGTGSCWPTNQSPFVNIVIPDDRPVNQRPFIGPNNDLESPDVNCGAAMIIKRLDTDLGNGDLDFTFKVVLPVVNAKVTLRKALGQRIEQGFTANSGKLKILGATAGDELFAVKGFPEYYSNHWPIANARIAVADLELIASDPTPMAVQVEAISGTQLRLRCDFDSLQPVRPFIDLWDQATHLLSESLSVAGNSYVSSIVSSAGTDGDGYILGIDDSSHSFTTIFNYQWHKATTPNVITGVVTSDYGCSLLLDSLSGTSDALLSTCFFPAPEGGLPTDIRGMSAQYNFSTVPSLSVLAGDNKIRISMDAIQADSAESNLYSIFAWNSMSHSWEPLPTQSDFFARNVTASISKPGLFMAVAHGINCCSGTTGNVNESVGETPDLSDLSLLISYLIVTPRPVLPCIPEANVNAAGAIDLSDLSLLIRYLTTVPRPTLPNCP